MTTTEPRKTRAPRRSSPAESHRRLRHHLNLISKVPNFTTPAAIQSFAQELARCAITDALPTRHLEAALRALDIAAHTLQPPPQQLVHTYPTCPRCGHHGQPQ